MNMFKMLCRFCKAALPVLAFALLAQLSFAGEPLANFAGSWKNLNANTRDIVKMQIQVSGANITIHVWGACQPAPLRPTTAWNTVAYSPEDSF